MSEKRLEAIALKYDKSTEDVPKVIGKGKGKIAKSILEIARENNVPIQEDASLTELLGKLNINESIPQELYEAVAEIFALIYQLDKKAKIEQKSSK
ncbi:EscU/YscU/HrcU family type III secretion system export apparatus switch protein [Bacillus sp. AGMB 02131]|uniref:EscU/YscU/HrcU family type III secretion system export apparatus switch protein n=1 Tax=Peribacillus faecalis TaxID=2772559 RepID=A0A927HB80_9BACI|nr:EscU/YscU/HrcU family type III secretion system export apparatus switch protein [Peribacillus faecalis]MBD3109460.1 EscU/YscU/HrcU family type III secretion system export apparatus switch protein [Peribacillus faecalis]